MTRLLLTGASGYLGAELLPHILGLPDLEVYALVRSDAQAEALSGMGIIPVRFDLTDQMAMIKSVEENTITVVFHLADAFNFAPAEAFLNGLASVKAKTGQAVHFLHTSGAKIFSSHAGIHRRLYDNEDIYTVQKTTEPAYAFMKTPVETCTSILELGDSLGVNTYIFVPPMVYGPRSGFGNKISIQYVDIIKIALELRTVYQVADPSFEWPLCHVQDVASLYALIAKAIHEKKTLPHGRKDGYFFAVNGEYKWKDLYQGIANSLASRSLIDSNALSTPTDDDLQRMAEVLGKGPKPLVDISVGGSCALTASNGAALGWTPQYGVDHLLSTIDAEVQFILDNLK